MISRFVKPVVQGWLRAMSRLWSWLGRSKDQISALQSLVAIVALAVGAAWVLIHFDIPSELAAEVRLEQTVTAHKALDDVSILQVDVTLTNSGKKSITYACHQIFINEFLPLSDENAENLRRGVKSNTNFDYKPTPMKALHEGNTGLVAPASSSTSWRGFYSISPYAWQYVSIQDKSTKVKSIVVRSRFYADPQCLPKLDRDQSLSFNEVTSVFDMEANTSAPSSQQQAAGPSNRP
jgi:hypothetical protein